MKIVLASDSFKGSLSCSQINGILIDVINNELKNCTTVPLLIADGGDGTLDAIITQKHGLLIKEKVSNPLFELVESRYGVFCDTAVISMCECSGLTLIPEGLRNPLKTTSYGTGELIRKAIEGGKKKILITLGGSATNDGGIGALTALGYRFIKRDGTCCKGIGEELSDIVEIDSSNALKSEGIDFTILSDVTNPLLGEKGASKSFGKQKGATNEQIDFLEKGMTNFSSVIEKFFSKNPNDIVGGGAAGGLGASLALFLNAKIKSGIDVILDEVGFDDIIKDADYVITGEGRIDGQSKDGKVISGILKRTSKKNIPVIAIVGSVGDKSEELYECGLTSVFSIIDKPSDLETILLNSQDLYYKTAMSVIRLIKNVNG